MIPSAWAVKKGDSERDMRKEMGKPSGVIKVDEVTKIYSFDRGEITVVEGVVTKIDLLPGGKTWGDVSKSKEASQAEREKFDSQVNNKPLLDLLASSSFQKLKNKDKIAKLQEFAKVHPQANVQPEIEKVEADIQAERDAKLGIYRPSKEDEEKTKKEETPKAEPKAETTSPDAKDSGKAEAPAATTTNAPAAKTK